MAPCPRRRSTSQREAVHGRGSRPLRSTTCGARPSTAARPTKWPATVLSRKSTSGVGPARPTSASSVRAASSSTGRRSPAPEGTPNQATRSERAEAVIRSTAWEALRSCATLVPARMPKRTAVPTAIPAAASSAPDERRRTRFHASESTYAAPRIYRSALRRR